MRNDDARLPLRRVVAKAVRAFGAAQAASFYECPDGPDNREKSDEYPPAAFIAVMPAFDPEGEARPEDSDVGGDSDDSRERGKDAALGFPSGVNDKKDGQ